MIAYNTDNPAPRELKRRGRKAHRSGEGLERRSSELRALRKRYPKLRWTEVAENDSEGLLSRLSDGKIDYVVTDSTAST